MDVVGIFAGEIVAYYDGICVGCNDDKVGVFEGVDQEGFSQGY